MAPRAAVLKQSDLTRYAKAMRAAGIEEWRVVVRPDGAIDIVAGKAGNKSSNSQNDWD